MPRPRVGTAYVHGEAVQRAGREVPKDDGISHWDIRATLPGGGRSKAVCLPLGTSEAMAREKALRLTQLAAKGDVRREKGGAAVTPKGGTIADLAKAWLRLLEAHPDLAPSTKGRHALSVNKWIVPKLGGVAPAELTTADLRGWIREHRSAGASPSSIRNAFFTLGRLIDDAAAEGWIDPETKNACRHSKVIDALPLVEAPEEIVHFTPSAAAAVIFTLSTPPERRMRYMLAALTGCREGELAGLRWENLSTEHGAPVLRVAAALAQVGSLGVPERRAPKTRESRRTIPIHSQLAPALAAWRDSGWAAFAGRAPTEGDPILPDENGKPWRGKIARRLQADLAAAGQPTTHKGESFTMHAFRRSFSTWLEAAGASGEHIDRLLGHARGSVRTRHYSAADLGALARAIETIRLPLAPPSTPLPPGGNSSGIVSETSESHGSARMAGAGLGLQNRCGAVLLSWAGSIPVRFRQVFA